jgi:NADH-quinone oxidoreductase subunit L
MTVPLVILAALAVFAGFLGLPAVLGPNLFEHWMEPVFAPLRPQPEFVDGILSHHGWEWLLMFVSVGIATAGALVALLFYVWKPDLPGRLAAAASGAYRVLLDKYYVDELYQAAIVRPLQAFTRTCARFDLKVIDGFVDGFARFWRGASDYTGWVDNTYIDGAVNGTAGAVAEAGRRTGRLQTGRLRAYLTATVAGAVGLLLLYNIWAARDLLLACVDWLLML